MVITKTGINLKLAAVNRNDFISFKTLNDFETSNQWMTNQYDTKWCCKIYLKEKIFSFFPSTVVIGNIDTAKEEDMHPLTLKRILID